jgi:hypothetical protein
MGRIADLDAELHELPDYEKGVQFERERIIKILQDEIGIDYLPIEDIIESIKNFGE